MKILNIIVTKLHIKYFWSLFEYKNTRTNKTKLLTLTFVLNKNKKYHQLMNLGKS